MPTSRVSGPRSPGRPRRTVVGYLYLLPALVLVSSVVHYGIAANVLFSTWDWNGVSPTHEDIGGANYLRMLEDPVFWQSLANTGLFAVITVTVQLVLGFLLAVLVRTRALGTGLLRGLLFVPVVISGAVVATSFRLILTPDGQFNQMLRAIGLTEFDHAWLASPQTALYVIAAINIWQFTGYSFVMYDAALGQVDTSVIEAARMDGAGTLRLISSVLFPLNRGTHLILIVLGAIGSLKTFELVFLTTGGGPGTSTEFLSTYIYRLAIPQFSASYSATLSIALVLLAMIFAVAQIRLSSARRG